MFLEKSNLRSTFSQILCPAECALLLRSFPVCKARQPINRSPLSGLARPAPCPGSQGTLADEVIGLLLPFIRALKHGTECAQQGVPIMAQQVRQHSGRCYTDAVPNILVWPTTVEGLYARRLANYSSRSSCRISPNASNPSP